MMIDTIYEWKWTVIYIAVHLLTFILYKYVFLAGLIKSHKDEKLREKYAPFFRKDLDDLQLISGFPFYITYWPRIFIGWAYIMFVLFSANLIMIGTKGPNYEKYGLRWKVCSTIMASSARVNLFLVGYIWTDV